MQTKAVITSFHNYCPMYDHKYFDVLLDYYIHNFNKYWRDEVDHLYLIDSNWDIEVDDPKITVIKTNPNWRYYEAYKEVLPQVKEDLVGLLDNDMVIYRKGVIEAAFKALDKADVASIYDTIGDYKTDKLNGKNKFCPYFFFTRKELLEKYKDVDWGSNMPEYETLGKLTEVMLADGLKPFEFEEDKTDIFIECGNGLDKCNWDVSVHREIGKNLGYYHVRAGSTAAYLLTTREFGNRQTYDDYLKNQPESELLRHIKWFEKMGGDASQIKEDLRKKLSQN